MIRICDLVISVVVMVLLAPLYLITAILIFLESGAPIFFRQKRVGQNDKEFVMIKFRSMKQDDRFSFLEEKQSPKDDSPELPQAYETTSVNDPRITRVGAFIRKFHIDELPQLINVALGEMSLVGPRPDVRAQEVDYPSHHWRKRTSVKPGLTGLAQVMSAKVTSVSRRTTLDVIGIRKASLCMYFWILVMTATKTLKGSSF